ncbi:MAG: flippase [Bacteroidetes bacterium]|nr:flippase [Bacteroidota bacterium]
MKILDSVRKDLNLTEIFRGGSIALIFKLLGILMGYVFFLIISRIYGAEKQGIFSLCWTILMLGAVLGRIGLDTAIVRFIAADVSNHQGANSKNLHRKGLALVLIASIFISMLFFAFSKQISDLFFDNTNMANLIRIIGLSIIPMSVMSYNAESLRALKKIGLFSFLQNGSIYIIILLILLSVSFLNEDINFLVQSILYALIFMAFISLFLFRTEEKKLPALSKNKDTMSVPSMLQVAFPMLLTNSLFLIMNWTDILMIGAFRSEADVGIYTIAVKIAALNTIALAAVNSIAAPKFAELYSNKNMKGLRRIVKQTTLINTVLSLPVFLIIILFPAFLMGLFGAEFEQGIIPLIILSCGQIFNAVSGSTMYILNMTNYEKTGQNILLVGAFINIVLNSLLIPKYGITGGAIATLSSTVIWNIIAIYYIYKHHGFLTYPFMINKIDAE